MLKNYLTIAFRNLKRHKLYSAINIFGLAVGMACCFLIMLFVMDELSYDRFHEKADRTFRVVKETSWKGEITKSVQTYSSLAPALKRQFPEVENAVRIYNAGSFVLRHKGQMQDEDQFFYVDTDFFQVFSFDFIQGNPEIALAEPNTIVLTKSLAEILFLSEDPMGKAVSVRDKNYVVTGVIHDPPENSHFKFRALTSLFSRNAEMAEGVYSKTFEDGGHSVVWAVRSYTYLVLSSSNLAESFEQKLSEFVASYEAAQYLNKRGETFRLFLQPLPDIHLYSHYKDEMGANYDVAYIYLFSAIAALVLIVAGINFVNLSTARFSQRVREVGVRKVVGASRGQLIQQFLGESILLAFIALFFALAMAELALPWFNALAQKNIAISNGNIYLIGVVALTLGVGVLAGCYPAFFLSGFRPVSILKGRFVDGEARGLLRRGLVVFQFVISIGLIVAFVSVYHQMQFVKHKRLGFDAEKIVVLHVRSIPEQWEAIKAELLRDPRIAGITASMSAPAQDLEKHSFRPEGFDPDNDMRFWAFLVDYDFLDVYQTEIVAGRTFSKEFPTDQAEGFILNEAAVKALGWDDPINKKFDITSIRQYRNFGKGRVIGVVEDFHFQSLHHKIEPAVFLIQYWIQYYSIRIQTEDVAGALAFMESTYRKFAPHHPMTYHFLDDSFAQYYQAEEKLMRLFATFTGLAIVIACLGLFGLATFTTERRTKEVGIRKVLGASISGIVMLLSKDFLKLVLIANVIAWPVAYWAMRDWLANFAYRIDLGWEIFVFSGGLALAIALLTVGYQAWQAARSNPVDALRYE